MPFALSAACAPRGRVAPNAEASRPSVMAVPPLVSTSRRLYVDFFIRVPPVCIVRTINTGHTGVWQDVATQPRCGCGTAVPLDVDRAWQCAWQNQRLARRGTHAIETMVVLGGCD